MTAPDDLHPPPDASDPVVRPGAPRAASLALGAVLLAYLALWVGGMRSALLDTTLQNDDARAWVMPFHRFGPEEELAADPVAREMASLVPPAMHGLYALLVPAVGLLAAPKVVQALCFGLVGVAGVLVARAPRGGTAAAALLVFLSLRTHWVVDHTMGGVPRAFAFPLATLWIAGGVAALVWARRAAVLLGALLYPPTAVLLLAAEGLFALRGLARMRPARRWRTLGRRVLAVGALAAVAAACVAPQLVAKREAGRPRTVAEGAADGSLGPHGRVRELPFPPPLERFARYAAEPFRVEAHVVGGIVPTAARDPVARAVAVATVAGALVLVAARRAPVPRAALALAGAAVVVYVAARLVAFRLYSPARAYYVGPPAAVVAAWVVVVGQALPRGHRRARREAIRARLAVGTIVGFVVLLGDGIDPRNAVHVDARDDAALHAFVRALPRDVRIAAHPMDGISLPLFTGRATTGNYETLQPWFDGLWRTQVARTTDTLRVLYATRPEELRDYCVRYGITHLLLHTDRYTPRFRRNAHADGRQDRHGATLRSMERIPDPFRTWLERELAAVRHRDLVLAEVPDEAVVFRDRKLLLVDVRALAAAAARGAWPVPAAARAYGSPATGS